MASGRQVGDKNVRTFSLWMVGSGANGRQERSGFLPERPRVARKVVDARPALTGFDLADV